MGVEIDTLLRTQSGTGHLISKYVYHLTGNSTSGNLFWRNSQPGMGRGRHTRVRHYWEDGNAAKGCTTGPGDYGGQRRGHWANFLEEGMLEVSLGRQAEGGREGMGGQR